MRAERRHCRSKDSKKPSRKGEVRSFLELFRRSTCSGHPADTFLHTGGIRTIPPGFTRGLDFGPLADDPTSALIEEEEEEVEVKPIYRPMLELSNEAGRARAITVGC